MSSIFIADFAPIDESDGSGMNLLDIHSRDWSDNCLEVRKSVSINCILKLSFGVI